MDTRRIIHIDMDAFFASVEQKDNPALRGKAVIVGGDPEKRGVVAACSYEARKYGIHSAMSSRRAVQLCPGAIFIRPRIERYREISIQIRRIFHEFTELVEPVSLDEAYLDVTGCVSATLIAQEIRKKIFRETGLTASAGVSFNKFLAKVASDHKKPDGMTVIRPDQASGFLDRLPTGRFHGIGTVTEKKMAEMGIKNGADLKKISRQDLRDSFGIAGEFFYNIVRGIDKRPVETERLRKSAGREVTLDEDTDDIEIIRDILKGLAPAVYSMLERYGLRARTVTLKLKYSDFTSITRSITLTDPVDDPGVVFMNAAQLLKRTEAGARKVRLVGITVSHLENADTGEENDRQLSLPFDREMGIIC